MERILVLEDDERIREELCTLLRNNGYEPVSQLPCELALLDANMPGESGFEICRKLRETSSLPVIFLTARTSPEDELLGFALGADDFIRKPYNSAVLLARIGKRLHRKKDMCMEKKGIRLNLTALRVSAGDLSCELTKNEARILACLMNKELCSKEDIIQELWNNSLYIDENTLYVNISRLRDKLKEIGRQDLITTVRAVGYRL